MPAIGVNKKKAWKEMRNNSTKDENKLNKPKPKKKTTKSKKQKLTINHILILSFELTKLNTVSQKKFPTSYFSNKYTLLVASSMKFFAILFFF